MALIDVNELLYDPDFVSEAGALFYVRNVASIGEDGIVTTTPQRHAFEGAVYPDRPANLDFYPEASRVASRIKIVTFTRLQTMTDTTQADTIQWESKEFLVRAIEDYTNYGGGFVVATCELKTFTDAQRSPQYVPQPNVIADPPYLPQIVPQPEIRYVVDDFGNFVLDDFGNKIRIA